MQRICFVCQSGPLEPKAILLAASLRLHFPPAIELIAAHPTLVGPLRPETTRALSDLRVVPVPIRNPMRDDFPVGHKLAALELLSGSTFGVLLDSDTLAMAPPEPLSDTLAAVPATGNHYTLQVWQRAYRHFGLSLPPSTSPPFGSGDRLAPYYNSGMIAVPGRIAGCLAASWIDTAMRLDTAQNVPRLRFLDQLALPIAAMRLGLAIQAIDPRWNHPGWALRLGDRPPPIIFHYQGVDRLRAEAMSLRAAQRAANFLPSVRDALAALSCDV